MTSGMRKRYLSEFDLNELETFTVVWDKAANRFFKLNDGSWVSENLSMFSAHDLTSVRVSVCPVR